MNGKLEDDLTLSFYKTGSKRLRRCESSDSDPVFKSSPQRRKRQRKSTKFRHSSATCGSSDDSDPVFKTLRPGRSDSDCRKRRKTPTKTNDGTNENKKPNKRVAKVSESSTEDECPPCPVDADGKKRKQVRYGEKSQTTGSKGNDNCGCQTAPLSGSIIRQILCFLGLDRRRNNSSSDKSGSSKKVVRSCDEKKRTTSPDERSSNCRSSRSESPSRHVETMCNKNCNDAKKDNKAPKGSIDLLGENHPENCICPFCPTRSSNSCTVDDILVTEETGHLVTEAIQEMLCQRLEERLGGVEKQIKDSEREFWAKYIPSKICPRCKSNEGCLLHSGDQQRSKCLTCG